MPLTLISLQARLRELSMRPIWHVQDLRDLQREIGVLADALTDEGALADPRDAHGHRIYDSRHAAED